MQFRTFGNEKKPSILLLHGGGLSWWSWQPIITLLEKDYHIHTAILDGHGDDHLTPFTGIEQAADHILSYIDTYLDGSVHMICGLSIGAQIALELLSKRENITSYAIIESALVLPIKGITTLTVPTYALLFGLIKQKWFSRLQAKSLFVPDNMFELYYEDSIRMTKQSLINMTISNGNYSAKEGLKKSRAKTLILVGGKELGIMKKSAELLSQTIPSAELQILPGLKHGELSLTKASAYVDSIQKLENQLS